MPFPVEIKRLYSLDLPDGSELPEDPSDCWIRINLDIGPTGSPGADTFRFVACTPRALQEKLAKSRFVWGPDLLIVSRFDWPQVEAVVGELVASVAGQASDWDEFVRLFGRHASWEFEAHEG